MDLTKTIGGKLYEKKVILADVNIPYKFSLNRSTNHLFFCINADEFSEQSFNSVVLDLHSGCATIVPSIRNGFASAIDQASGAVYLGGSDGIYRYNYKTQDVTKPAIIPNIDIFDLFFHKYLYFVDTANQNLYIYKDNKVTLVPELKNHQIKHFVVDSEDNVIFVNEGGLFLLSKGAKSPLLYDSRAIYIRGATIDTSGLPYFVAQDGIYKINDNNVLHNIMLLENGYGLAFDKDNNMFYSDERTVNMLICNETHSWH